ncbi:MAG: hypothetical protein N2Z59_04590 [Alteraurantiacibacter sp.]|nr:hypothetical protein [Alteraurantiacibacter sp.]
MLLGLPGEGTVAGPDRRIGVGQVGDVAANLQHSCTDAILPLPMRENVILLFPVQNWRLIWYRKADLPRQQDDIAQQFQVRSVLDAPTYPAFCRNWP